LPTTKYIFLKRGQYKNNEISVGSFRQLKSLSQLPPSMQPVEKTLKMILFEHYYRISFTGIVKLLHKIFSEAIC